MRRRRPNSRCLVNLACPHLGEGWQRSLLTALFMTQEAAEEAARLLADAGLFRGQQRDRRAASPDQDWVRLTQAQFAPVAITPDFWIVPSWHEAPGAGRQLIRLDGPCIWHWYASDHAHVTCAGWRRAGVAGARVLDYGCGSGILAIGAAKSRRYRWMRWISTQQPSPRRATMPPTMRQACAVACPTWSNLPRPVRDRSGQHSGVASESAGSAALRPSAPAGIWCWPAFWNARPRNYRKPMRQILSYRSPMCKTAGAVDRPAHRLRKRRRTPCRVYGLQFVHHAVYHASCHPLPQLRNGLQVVTDQLRIALGWSALRALSDGLSTQDTLVTLNEELEDAAGYLPGGTSLFRTCC